MQTPYKNVLGYCFIWCHLLAAGVIFWCRFHGKSKALLESLSICALGDASSLWKPVHSSWPWIETLQSQVSEPCLQGRGRSWRKLQNLVKWPCMFSNNDQVQEGCWRRRQEGDSASETEQWGGWKWSPGSSWWLWCSSSSFLVFSRDESYSPISERGLTCLNRYSKKEVTICNFGGYIIKRHSGFHFDLFLILSLSLSPSLPPHLLLPSVPLSLSLLGKKVSCYLMSSPMERSTWHGNKSSLWPLASKELKSPVQ